MVRRTHAELHGVGRATLLFPALLPKAAGRADAAASCGRAGGDGL
jgi:hypothetical protein